MTKLTNLTKEALIRLYIEKKMSLEDIAKLYGVSRVAIYRKLMKLHVKQRSKSQARLEAQKQRKVPQQYLQINERFFASWSAEVAYVLGLISTDGCISKTGTISLSMNDSEILEKVKRVMMSDHQIIPSKHQKGLYYFNFARERLVKDLAKFGIGPKKSLKVKFPQISEAFIIDFIRGVFDGDGSVFFRKENRRFPLVTSFCSGSKDFITKLELSLQELGLPKRKIYEQKTKNGFFYNFKYSHKNSKKLFNILYKDYPNILFLERKYNKFLEGFKRNEFYGKRTKRVV